MLMALSNPIINRSVLPKRSHKRSPMYPNCTATTSHASGIQSGERQIIGPPPIEIIKRVRAIDQPRVSCELRESHYNSEQKKWHEQCAPPNDPKPDKQTIIDKI